MDGPTFLVEVLKAVAWPGVVLTAVLLLRKQLRALVPLLTKLKYKDLELVFGREAAEARAEAANLPPPPGRAVAPLPQISPEVQRLLSVSPRAAIMEAWREVEQAARESAIRRQVSQPGLGTIAPGKLANLLAVHGILEPPQLGLFHDLRALRNQAAHAPEFVLSEDAARDFVEAAGRLIDYLKSG